MSATPPLTVGDFARDYTARGWRVVPVPYRSKGPVVDGWQRLRLDGDQLAGYFDESRVNVGVLLGEPSADLIDIDLDAPQAVALADEFLPPTASRFGRASKASSHRLYVASPLVPTEKFQDIEKAGEDDPTTMLVEVRSTGAQTVFPGSTHPSGEVIEWESDGEPATVDGEDLRRCVTYLAVAALLARHWPDKGTRDEAALAAGGALLRAGLGEDLVRRIIGGAARVAGDEQWGDREKAVHGTAEKLCAGDPVTGGPRLAELLRGNGEKVVRQIKMWLNRVRTSGAAATAEPRSLREAVRNAIVNDGVPSFDRKRNVAALIRDELRRRGAFYRTRDGRRYFFSRIERQLYDLDHEAFRHLLTAVSGLSATEPWHRFVQDVVRVEEGREAPYVEVRAVAHCELETGVLSVSAGEGRVWRRERGGRWTAAYNGDDGVFFLTDPTEEAWEPEFANKEALPAYLSGFLFEDGVLSAEDQRTLVLVFLLQQLFPTLQRTRVIPAFLGGQGSGKTSGCRRIGRLLLGPRFDVSGIHRDREDAFVALVTNSAVAALDNADARVPWLEDSLATYATGRRYDLRRLYTTNERVSYEPRAILLLNSRDPQFRRADVAERLLPLRCTRPPSYLDEASIADEIRKLRPGVWGTLLERAAGLADALLRQTPPAMSFRMADFAAFGWRVFNTGGPGPDWPGLLRRLERAQTAFAAEGDGVVEALRRLLERDGAIGPVTTGDLFKLSRPIAEEENLPFPATASGFGQRFTTMRRVIELELRVRVVEATVGGGRRKVTLIPQDQSLRDGKRSSEPEEAP